MEIGKKLKIIREAAGMNQAEVAEKVREIRIFKDRFAIEFQG